MVSPFKEMETAKRLSRLGGLSLAESLQGSWGYLSARVTLALRLLLLLLLLLFIIIIIKNTCKEWIDTPNNSNLKSSEAMLLAVVNAILLIALRSPENFTTSTGFEPVTSRYRCNALTN